MALKDLLPGKLGFGTAPLGNMFREIPEAEARATVEAAWNDGMRYVDHAPVFGAGLGAIGLAYSTNPGLVILGIFLFAIGEMASSPRIQEYITWLAPKEKAGLYMGANFLALSFGAFSGPLYQFVAQRLAEAGHPDAVWYVLAGHVTIGALVLYGFVRIFGEFREQEA